MYNQIKWRVRLFLTSPASAWYALVRRVYNLANLFLRSKKVKCNICYWEGYRFSAIAGADYIRYNAGCPVCGSVERNRALIEYMNKRGDFSGKQVKYLDIGPIKGARDYFEAKDCDYVSIDLDSEYAMIKMDVMKLEFPDDTFDIIICSHVLEHVKDDLLASREIARVMKPGGTGYIMVPFNENRTETIEYEKPNPREPHHVRSYGRDFIDRIASAGFRVQQIDLVAEAGEADAKRYGLGKEEICFFCTKSNK
jgi:SAM-dependent methyltransferase